MSRKRMPSTPPPVGRYNDCPRRWCYSPGMYDHRGASGIGRGSHNTGHTTRECMHNAYHGCPCPLPIAGEARDAYWARVEAGKEGQG